MRIYGLITLHMRLTQRYFQVGNPRLSIPFLPLKQAIKPMSCRGSDLRRPSLMLCRARLGECVTNDYDGAFGVLGRRLKFKRIGISDRVRSDVTQLTRVGDPIPWNVTGQ